MTGKPSYIELSIFFLFIFLTSSVLWDNHLLWISFWCFSLYSLWCVWMIMNFYFPVSLSEYFSKLYEYVHFPIVLDIGSYYDGFRSHFSFVDVYIDLSSSFTGLFISVYPRKCVFHVLSCKIRVLLFSLRKFDFVQFFNTIFLTTSSLINIITLPMLKCARRCKCHDDSLKRCNRYVRFILLLWKIFWWYQFRSHSWR